jgi:serine/threonine-protein kinase
MAHGLSFEHCGPYRIVRQIGSGGMGSIFEAIDIHLGNRVALKRLHPHVASRPGATARFLREGRAAARIRHPHVVQVLALGEHDALPYLAMELLEGSDLGARLSGGQRLAVPQALELLFPVMAAVAAAHGAGVIHRDLKPSNIFVAHGVAGKAWPKVLDFGVSKVLGTDGEGASTEADAVLGTAAYMAPEQARSARHASFQSDQYSLAVILYQCLTGRVPFSAANDYELLSAIMSAPIEPPGRIVAGLPMALESALLRALHRKPDLRFPSVRAFGASLLAFASERDRLAWGMEFESEDSAPRAMADAGMAATGPATMPPTAKDTRAVQEAKRQAGRVATRLLGVGGVLTAVSLAVLASRVGSHGRPTLATPAPSESTTDRAGSSSLEARGSPARQEGQEAATDGARMATQGASTAAAENVGLPASVTSSSTMSLAVRRPHGSQAPTGSAARTLSLPPTPSAASSVAPLTSAAPAPSAGLVFGENGAPILP